MEAVTDEVADDQREVRLSARLAEIERQQRNLAKAIAQTGDIDTLADEIKALERETGREAGTGGDAGSDREGGIDLDAVREQLFDAIRDWRTTLTKRPSEVQPLSAD